MCSSIFIGIPLCVCVVVVVGGGAIRRSNSRGYFAQSDAELVSSRGTKSGYIGDPAWGRRDTWLARREVRVWTAGVKRG